MAQETKDLHQAFQFILQHLVELQDVVLYKWIQGTPTKGFCQLRCAWGDGGGLVLLTHQDGRYKPTAWLDSCRL